MICVSLQNKDCNGLLEALDRCRMAEIRIDRCPELTDEDIAEVFSCDLPLVATCRISEIMKRFPEMSPIKAASFAEKCLKTAIESGATYVDLEIEAPKEMAKRIREVADDSGALVIRSFHDFKGTDSEEALKAIVEKCCYHNSDIVKIVTTAHSEEDVERVMSLYSEFKEESLIAFCMGEKGHLSRLDALRAGAPFTYAALSEGEETAPGQWTADEMTEAVYAGVTQFDADVTVPTSKSYAQRAIIAAALADGVSILGNYTPCGDSEAAIEFARSIGAQVDIVPAGDMLELSVKGIAATEGCLDGKLKELSVGESGLLARIAIPLMAQLSDNVKIVGTGTLKDRQLLGATEIMSAMGSSLVSDLSAAASMAADSGHTKSHPYVSGDEFRMEHLPLTVSGRLTGTKAEISGENGSQLVSGLLMAMPFSHKNMSLLVENPKSIPYSFMTMDVLKKFGIKVSNEMLGDRDFLESNGDWSLCTEMIFKVRAGQKYTPAELCLEGDWSYAAPFLCAAAVFGKAYVDGLNTESLQADLAVMDVLIAAGAAVSQMDGAEGEIYVQQAPLMAFNADLTHCPDLFPVLSVFAAFCQGRSTLTGLSRLRHKECDRCEAISEMLNNLGVNASIANNGAIANDELLIDGQSLAWRKLNGKMLKGGQYSSHHDHRMVMALKFASLGADSEIVIDDCECVAKSAPHFIEEFESSFRQ